MFKKLYFSVGRTFLYDISQARLRQAQSRECLRYILELQAKNQQSRRSRPQRVSGLVVLQKSSAIAEISKTRKGIDAFWAGTAPKNLEKCLSGSTVITNRSKIIC